MVLVPSSVGTAFPTPHTFPASEAFASPPILDQEIGGMGSERRKLCSSHSTTYKWSVLSLFKHAMIL